MNRNAFEKGQALILIVFAIVGLVGLTALAVDGGVSYADRQKAQSAADTAALRAALQLAKAQTDWSSAATSAAASNGFNNDGTTNTVTVRNPPGAGCNGTTATYAVPSQYVQVLITSTVRAYFAPVVGIRQTTNCVEAVAKAVPGTGGSFGGGNGLMVLKSSVCGCQPLSFTGSGNVTVQGGVVDNGNFSSTGSGLFTVAGGVRVRATVTHTGSGNITIGGGFAADSLTKTGSQDWSVTNGATLHSNFSQTGSGDFVVNSGTFTYGGSYSNTGSGTVSPAGVKTNPAPAQPPIFTDPLASVLNPPTAPPSSPCNGDQSFTGSTSHTLAAGCYGAVNQTGSGNLTLNPGRFTSINNTGSGVMTLNPGLYYITGSNGIRNTGSGDVIGNGVLIYMADGGFNMTGSGDLTLTPMTTGDYKGLTIYMDRSNDSAFSMTGSGNSTFSGTVYAPASDLTFTGSGTPFVLDSQIIGYTATLTGSGGLSLAFNASHNFQVPSDAMVQLVK
ncbi:MAG TPA: pilus assembly protein TadG-related protein [Anaerolineales bacterium]|nr:pilus assembly protein TadG-related protein [Anaerolineales bacterium]